MLRSVLDVARHPMVFACVAGAVLVWGMSLPALAADGSPRLDVGRGGQCVRDPQWMRRNHMHLLKHQRDMTVHKGVRVDREALKTCVECHASVQDDSVTAREDSFCVGCHRYAAVSIDCFECHASKRRQVIAGGGRNE